MLCNKTKFKEKWNIRQDLLPTVVLQLSLQHGSKYLGDIAMNNMNITILSNVTEVVTLNYSSSDYPYGRDGNNFLI